MKKIILFTAIVMGLYACKKPTGETVDAPAETDAAAPAVAAVSCGTIITVDVASIADPNERTQWHTDNDKYRCTPTSTPTPLGTPCSSSDKVYISLEEIKGADDNATRIAQSEWLQNNGAHICYNETYRQLEAVHHVVTSAEQDELKKVPDTDITFKKLSEIKDEILKKGGNYNDDKYSHYLYISYSPKNLLLTLSKGFDPTHTCISIPYLRSLSLVNNLQGDPVYGFFVYKDHIYIRIQVPTSGGGFTYEFYNYSQVPAAGEASANW